MRLAHVKHHAPDRSACHASRPLLQGPRMRPPRHPPVARPAPDLNQACAASAWSYRSRVAAPAWSARWPGQPATCHPASPCDRGCLAQAAWQAWQIAPIPGGGSHDRCWSNAPAPPSPRLIARTTGITCHHGRQRAPGITQPMLPDAAACTRYNAPAPRGRRGHVPARWGMMAAIVLQPPPGRYRPTGSTSS